MRFSCDVSELNASLSIVSRALAVRSPKPILEGILLESCEEGLRLTCTDLALGIETIIPATFIDEGRILEEGTPDEVFNHPKQARTQDFLSKVL